MSNTMGINAIIGGDNNAPSTDVDWKQKCADLEKELQTQRVEQGRLKKTAEELEKAKAELEEFRANKRRASFADSLSEEERENIPDEVLSAATKLVTRGMDELKAEQEQRFRDMEARRAQDEENNRKNAESHFLAQIDAAFPGFRSSVTTGGDKESAWAEYLKYNKSSIASAFTSGDFNAFAYHVEQFYRNFLGVSTPSGEQVGSAAPDPRINGGGSNGKGTHPGKYYTQSEFLKLYDLLEDARERGDFAEVKRLDAEIQNAPAEGRVQ